MGLFDRQKEPVFLKTDSEAEKQLAALRKLRGPDGGESTSRLAQEIRIVEAGIAGEERILFELKNSHMPMYILHDLFLEREGLTAQIDYLIVTPYDHFVLECKNLFGNIEVNDRGEFIRTFNFGRETRKEGLYSPITQNRRHLELIRQIRADTKGFIGKALFEKNFYDTYRSLIVLANPKTVVNMGRAPKDVQAQILRADQLVAHIRERSEKRSDRMSDKATEELARFFLDAHRPQNIDYLAKYRKQFASDLPKAAKPESVVCPKCGAPMVKRKAQKGKNAGQEFYGCSRYPKCRGILNIKPT